MDRSPRILPNLRLRLSSRSSNFVAPTALTVDIKTGNRTATVTIVIRVERPSPIIAMISGTFATLGIHLMKLQIGKRTSLATLNSPSSEPKIRPKNDPNAYPDKRTKRLDFIEINIHSIEITSWAAAKICIGDGKNGFGE